jgi:3-hydroxyethyl bacteriochlorophyllide a dehydrogenase
MQTTAVVISAPHEVGLQCVTLKPLAANEVAVQTRFTSISAGTERMLLAGQMPHPMLQLPVVPGYETVGAVVEVGADVDQSWLGRNVYVGGAMCYADVNGAWGGQSARLHVSAERAVPLDTIPLEHGTLLALSATALHGVDLLNTRAGDRVLILGQGPVGQLAARFLCSQGVEVIVTDKNPQRLERSVASRKIDVSSAEITLSEPVHAIIDATGSMNAIAAALAHLKVGGTILLLGYYQKLDLPYMPLFLKEAKLLTAKEWAQGDLQRSRDAIANGTIDVAPLLTHTFENNAIKSAYDTAMNDLACLKTLIQWS